MADQFFDNMAELGSEEDDEDFDGDAAEPRTKPSGENGMDDSSEEEDDDDEDRIRQVRHYHCYPASPQRGADSCVGRRRLHC